MPTNIKPDYTYSDSNCQWKDRTWFDARPKRVIRMRKPSAEEFANVARGCTHVIVLRLSQSERLRTGIVLVGAKPEVINLLLSDKPKATRIEQALVKVFRVANEGHNVTLSEIFDSVAK